MREILGISLTGPAHLSEGSFEYTLHRDNYVDLMFTSAYSNSDVRHVLAELLTDTLCYLAMPQEKWIELVEVRGFDKPQAEKLYKTTGNLVDVFCEFTDGLSIGELQPCCLSMSMSMLIELANPKLGATDDA